MSPAGDIIAEPWASGGTLVKVLKEEITQAGRNAGKIVYFTGVAALLHEGVELVDWRRIADYTLCTNDELVAIMKASVSSLQLFWASPEKLRWNDVDIDTARLDHFSKTLTLHRRIPRSSVDARGIKL
eukprot:TRINITY_DN26812_c0_g1_i1.p2 TRINITY_DN26812_c0_g1~~TRINITY_DN26812_c0_g1_i1.p2  ORF type:complete len:128 (+),score=18.74 TRINITY_DN26812_c0_g1_i1:119-502(+)